MTFRTQILTLYPEMFPGPLGVSLAGRALAENIWSCTPINIRDFATDKHHTVDDTPAGGGAGMVLKPDVVASSVDFAVRAMAAHAKPLPFRRGVGVGIVHENRCRDWIDIPHPNPSLKGEGQRTPPIIAMTPRGAPLTQARIREIAAGRGVTILCGRFEGFDERIFAARDIEEVSIGDYILSGGELGAMVLLDACIRLLPGVMGAASSGDDESFESGLLEYPQFTRPALWEGHAIPQVLRSGDHAAVKAWRERQAEADTRSRRPDLWERHVGARDRPASGAHDKKKGPGS